MSRIILYDVNGTAYAVLQDSLRERKPRKVKVLKNQKQEHALRNAYRDFQNPDVLAPVGAIFSELVRAICNKDITSVSLGIYQEELQITFWEKQNGKATVVDSFSFTSIRAFLDEMKERDICPTLE
jgi:hypothetical protein